MNADDTGPFGPLLTTRLRVLTWNVWGRHGAWEARFEAIAATLAALEPDVVTLQEVWDDGVRNQARELGERLGFHSAFAPGLELDGAAVGNAVLARWPIVASLTALLPCGDELDERRTVLRADVAGPRGLLHVFATHLNWRFDHGHLRQAQVRALAAVVAESPARDAPPILGGDLNAEPDADEIRMLTGRAAVAHPGLVFHDAWAVAGDGTAGFTWSNRNPHAAPALEPNRRIDYVLVGWPRAGGAGHVLGCHVVATLPVAGVQPSDHYGVLAELRY